ncbi:MAG: acyl--CoA ligase [Candidatus Eremiobacteraeota bacterium]|nr:acyl--CoA ligase [Candidatus Eremiobacteraeota bacterium]MCW5868452.1 acyl--CoA ligase [Candidatus Eremiobacteraeota bacterium]
MNPVTPRAPAGPVKPEAVELAATYRNLIQGQAEQAWEQSQALPASALSGLVGLAYSHPLALALAFLRVLECGGSPVLMPTPEEARAYRLTVTLDEHGLHSGLPDPALEPRAGDFFAFSSGSTGQRRPLRFHHQKALGNARVHAQSLGITDQHTISQTLRLHHPFGVVAYIYTPLAVGARVELGVYFDALFPVKAEQKPTVVHLTPYHLQLLMRRRVESRFKVGKLSLGAGPVRRQEALYALGLAHELYTTYGLSEAGPRVSCGRVEAATFVDGWIGYFLEGIQTRVDEDGCLWLKTPYHAENLADFFNTGDRIDCLPDGSAVFKNRIHDVLRVRGQTYPRCFYQQRLQSLLGLPCEVAQSAYSDELIVFIETNQEQPALLRAIERNLPEFRGARVIWRETFCRTALGKTDLRTMLEELPR